jgi:hypothetical protein
MAISFDDIENAFFFVSMEQESMNNAYLCRETGKIFLESGFEDLDRLPEDIDYMEKYISIPHKNELDLGKALVIEFTSEYMPEELGKVHSIFSRRGAYSRYKDLLEGKGMLENWYKFQEERETSALKEWCRENNINIKE